MTNIQTPKRRDDRNLRRYIRAEWWRLIITLAIVALGVWFLEYTNNNYENNFENSFRQQDDIMVE